MTLKKYGRATSSKLNIIMYLFFFNFLLSAEGKNKKIQRGRFEESQKGIKIVEITER